MKRSWQLRAGPGALIILVHLVFFAALVRHAGMPSTRDETPSASYITFALVPATTTPKQVQAPVASPPPVPANAGRLRSSPSLRHRRWTM